MRNWKNIGDNLAMAAAGLAVLIYWVVGIIAYLAPNIITEAQIVGTVSWAIYFFLGAIVWGGLRLIANWVDSAEMPVVVLGHGCDHAFVAGPHRTEEVILLSRLLPPEPKQSSSGRQHHSERPTRRSRRRRRAA